MKKVMVGSLILVLVLLSVSFAGASLKVVGNVGYYAPNYGQINEELSALNTLTGMSLGFKSGVIYGIGLSNEISDKFEVRLEYNSFSSSTAGSISDSFTYGETTYRLDEDLDLELTSNPIILSLTYGFSPGASLSPYAGVGLGIFSTKLTGKTVLSVYEDGVLVDTYSFSDSYTNSPTGFLLLAGVHKDMTKNLILKGEVRYISSAKATFTDETVSPPQSIDCVLGGLMGNVGVEYRF